MSNEPTTIGKAVRVKKPLTLERSTTITRVEWWSPEGYKPSEWYCNMCEAQFGMGEKPATCSAGCHHFHFSDRCTIYSYFKPEHWTEPWFSGTQVRWVTFGGQSHTQYPCSPFLWYCPKGKRTSAHRTISMDCECEWIVPGWSDYTVNDIDRLIVPNAFATLQVSGVVLDDEVQVI